MVSDFRKKKYLHAFYTFFDENKDGNIEKREIVSLIKKVSGLRGWTANDSNYKDLEDIWNKVWTGMLKQVDVNNDGEISIDEWISVWDEYAKNPAAGQEWQRFFEEAVFKLIDNSNDQNVSEAEYVEFYAVLGLNKEDLSSAFKKSVKGKLEITRADHQELWKEFFVSDDLNSPGNFVCGAISF